jgi:hypothetical protein
VKSGRVRSSANTPSNIEITPHALQSAWETGLFNGKAVFIDHAAFWDPHIYGAPSIENLVGVTQSSTWNEAESAIEGTIKLYSNATGLSTAAGLSIAIVNCVDASSDELLTEPTPPDIGLSLVFYPIWEQNPPSPGSISEQSEGSGRGAGGEGGGEGLRRITGITHIESIDLVFEPAADGRVLQALSAHNIHNSETSHNVNSHNVEQDAFLLLPSTRRHRPTQRRKLKSAI